MKGVRLQKQTIICRTGGMERMEWKKFPSNTKSNQVDKIEIEKKFCVKKFWYYVKIWNMSGRRKLRRSRKKIISTEAEKIRIETRKKIELKKFSTDLNL